jgi:hypothetical protein
MKTPLVSGSLALIVPKLREASFFAGVQQEKYGGQLKTVP